MTYTQVWPRERHNRYIAHYYGLFQLLIMSSLYYFFFELLKIAQPNCCFEKLEKKNARRYAFYDKSKVLCAIERLQMYVYMYRKQPPIGK